VVRVAHSASALTEIRVGRLLFPDLALDVDTTTLKLVTPVIDELSANMLCNLHKEQRSNGALSKRNAPFTNLLRVVQAKRDFWLLYERGGRTLHELVFAIQGEFHMGSRVYRLEHRPLYQQMRADPRLVQVRRGRCIAGNVKSLIQSYISYAVPC
jgi:hypothetical protein